MAARVLVVLVDTRIDPSCPRSAHLLIWNCEVFYRASPSTWIDLGVVG